MLNTDLLGLINSGDCWLFVGSGISTDAGLPPWDRLVTGVVDALPPIEKAKVTADTRYIALLAKADYPACFGRVEALADRATLEHLVRQDINRGFTPSYLTKLITEWPFAGYVTTNYDHLLETALRDNNHLGWLSIGNSEDEIRKLSGNPRDLVWHVHGSALLPPTSNALVLTDKDYDRFYLNGSALEVQLKGFLTHHRFMFVGFGFKDPELEKLLKRVGTYTTPERPMYAVIGFEEGKRNEAEIATLREKYNVEVIPYTIQGNSHRRLQYALETYGPMVLRRSLRYGRKLTAAPSHDAETTGLLIYNTLVLNSKKSYSEEVLTALVTARVLSLVQNKGQVLLTDLQKDIGQSVALLAQTGHANLEEASIELIAKTVADLASKGQIIVVRQGADRALRLSTSGKELVRGRLGTANRIFEQFRASLLDRAVAYTDNDAAKGHLIGATAARFLEDCITKRALGVAMALNAPTASDRDFQMVALLQSLHEYAESLPSAGDARILMKVIEDVLARPSDAERKYCGLLLQGRLGVHLLGLHPTTLQARIAELQQTAFVLDSTTLIPLLAKDSPEQSAALETIKRLLKIGAPLVTTDYLVQEVREHANFALREVRKAGGEFNELILAHLLGEGGASPDAFLEGFGQQMASGLRSPAEFGSYMADCGLPGTFVTDAQCAQALAKLEIATVPFNKWEGITQEDLVSREELQEKIAERRRANLSYTHERQVKAEAEALVMINNLRSGKFTIEKRACKNAFFVSYSRIIDGFGESGLPVTMRQASALQWAGTLVPFSEEELPVLLDGLLAELSERGCAFVDKTRLLMAFSSVITAAKEEYPRVAEQHRNLIAGQWGVDPSFAFEAPVDELRLPSINRQHLTQSIDKLQTELASTKAAYARLADSRTLSQAERQEYIRLKTARQERIERNARKKRGRKANPAKP